MHSVDGKELNGRELNSDGECHLLTVVTAAPMTGSGELIDREMVSDHEVTIQEELLQRLNMASCEQTQKLCELVTPSDELGCDEAAAHSTHGTDHLAPSLTVIVDSGATGHMMPWRGIFTRMREGVRGKVALGSKSYSINIDGTGQTNLPCLSQVFWVPNLSMGLLSVPQLDRDGYTAEFARGKCVVKDRQSGDVVLTGTLRRNLYVIDKKYREALVNGWDPQDEPEGEYAMACETKEAERMRLLRGSAQPKLTQATAGIGALDRLHKELGHISETKLKKGLKNNSWIGTQHTYEELKHQKLKFCPACFEGQMKAFPRQAVSEKVVEPGAKFGVDYKGKFAVTSIDGYTGFYLMADYGSNWLMVVLVKNKNEEVTRRALEEFYLKIQLTTKLKPGIMQCDYDTVLRSEGITKWMREQGIKLQMSAPYTHWQNGKIERSIGKVMDTARTLMADGRVPRTFWSWAVRCAVYLLNRQPVYNLDTTPHEAASGEKPDISALVPFWSIGVYHKTKEERRGPWDVKAVRVRMIGYSEEAKNSYYVYEIGSARTIKVRHDCVWDETELLGEVSQDNLEGDLDADDLAAVEEELRNNISHLDIVEASGSDGEPPSEEDQYYWLEGGEEPYWAGLTEVEEWIEDAHAMAVRVLPEVRPANPMTPLSQPATLKEALEGPDGALWAKALQTEIDNFRLREVFISASQKGPAMKTKLILKRSWKPDGTIKYKVRLVAKGFTQIKGVNYNETYAPTTSTSVVLVVFQLAVIKRLNISSFDVTAAFLEGKNDYPNHAWLPAEFGELGGQRVQVVGNFYGEKQGPKIWNDRLNEILLKGEFERCPAHPCLYRKEVEDDVQFMCVHVDDGLAATNNTAMKAEFKDHLLSEVREATFDDAVKRYTGIDVSEITDKVNGSRRVKLTHEQYISENWGDFAASAEVKTPISDSHNLRKAEPVESDLTMLHDTGKFRFACDRARPDILVATGEIATGGDKNPSLLHEVVSKRTKQYLYHTRTLGIELGEGELEIFGYSDAAYITEGNCKSRLGGCIFMNRTSGAIRAFSKTDSQPSSVSHSSTEAEIKAMDEWVREVLHIVDIVSFLIGRRYDTPIKLFVDNLSAIQLCTTLKQNHNVKHINVRITFIRELFNAGFITIHHVGTEDNTADVLTKALGQELYTKHRKTLLTGHDGQLPTHK